MNRQNFSLTQSISLCRQIVAKYDRTFYWGSWLLPPSKRRAMWTVYAWFRQKDEFIDGRETLSVKQARLDRWFEQLEALFTSGHPSLPTDIALLDTIQSYHLPMEPFQDMLLGQQMDLEINRYQTWEDLRLYCYRVAGTVGLVSALILGSVSGEDAAGPLVTLGVAMQLTNILQDVGADARRGRIYLPLEDLKHFSYAEQDIFKSTVDQRWIALMNYEIQRSRKLYRQAAKGLSKLRLNARLPIWLALIRYRHDLRSIERDHYRVFGASSQEKQRQRAQMPCLSKVKALLTEW